MQLSNLNFEKINREAENGIIEQAEKINVMAKVKITGAFKGTENLNVDIEVYRPNPDGYSFRSAYNKDFVKTFDDMIPGRLYFVDLTGQFCWALMS